MDANEKKLKPDDLVIFISKRGTYWDGDKERFTKDRSKAEILPWHRASLHILMGAAKGGHWEKI